MGGQLLLPGGGAECTQGQLGDPQALVYITTGKEHGALKELLDDAKDYAKTIRTQSERASDEASELSTMDTQSGKVQEEDV